MSVDRQKALQKIINNEERRKQENMARAREDLGCLSVLGIGVVAIVLLFVR